MLGELEQIVLLAVLRVGEGAYGVPVHDEIVLECDAANAERTAAWLRKAMEDAMRPILEPVPVAVEVSHGPTWGG